MPGRNRKGRSIKIGARRGSLGMANGIFSWKRRKETPETPPEAIAALAESDLFCERCNAKFGRQESWAEHKTSYHQERKQPRKSPNDVYVETEV
jgi:hypothetical protein